MGSEIVGSKEIKVSPSAIVALFGEKPLIEQNGCARKFAFQYWSGIKAPEGAGAVLGTAVHSQIEGYLTHGQLDFTKDKRAAEIASSGIHLLPKPGQATPEGAFTYEYKGIKFTGRIDWIYLDKPTNWVQVGDAKTSKDLKKYQKTPEDLDLDPQAIIYSNHGLNFFPDATGVQLRWVYMQTKGAKKAAPTETYFSPQIARQKLDLLLPLAEQVISLRKEKADPNSLPPNTDRCGDFGGCPYREHCKLSFSERIRSMSNSVQDQLAALKARMNPQPGITTGRTQSSEPNQANTEIKAPEMPAPTAGDPINPPEAKTEPARLDADKTATGKTILTAHVQGQNGPVHFAGPATAHVDTETGKRTELIATEEPKKRGRPKKADTAQVAADLQRVAGQPLTPEFAVTLKTAKPIGILYVDCVPMGLNYFRVSSFLDDAMKRLNEGLQSAGLPLVDDWRMVDYKGGGMLALSLLQVLSEHGNVDRLYVDSTTPEGKAVLETLKSSAGEVVKGV